MRMMTSGAHKMGGGGGGSASAHGMMRMMSHEIGAGQVTGAAHQMVVHAGHGMAAGVHVWNVGGAATAEMVT